MSEFIDDGGSAFPFGKKNFTDDWSHGMSLRDWFAGQALAGWFASFAGADSSEVSAFMQDWKHSAKTAYQVADAMLAARKEKQ